ncbi:unnamed protein product [Symbiodinium natans]|uniref:Uncharacterized protein n=1 Tax=Symbiodinium natans TaxID=878477 RepID=A0A812QXT2_9DINO|nr:unnamed protein product [Symbiodinium natans]
MKAKRLIPREPVITSNPEILEEAFSRALVPGVKVEIHGLQSSPELNGKSGTIMTLANERGRWEVEVKKGSDTWPVQTQAPPPYVKVGGNVQFISGQKDSDCANAGAGRVGEML